MDNIATLLDEEIVKTLNEISSVKSDSNEAKAAMIKLNSLHNQRVKELEAELKVKQLTDASLFKIDELNLRKNELETEVELKKNELAQKDAELKEAKKSRRWKTVLDILGITVPTAATGFWIWKGLKFEEEGKIYSSRTMQWVSGFTRMFKKNG